MPPSDIDIDTTPASVEWCPRAPRRYRRSEATAEVQARPGESDAAAWARATEGVLHWRIKTASGFRLDDDARVTVGARRLITFGILTLRIVEPVEVVTVVETPTRVGFSYRTLPGHPVSGEEAFIVQRDGAAIRVTVRSLTAPSDVQPWRALHPLLRLAQRVVRRRYLRALSA